MKVGTLYMLLASLLAAISAVGEEEFIFVTRSGELISAPLQAYPVLPDGWTRLETVNGRIKVAERGDTRSYMQATDAYGNTHVLWESDVHKEVQPQRWGEQPAPRFKSEGGISYEDDVIDDTLSGETVRCEKLFTVTAPKGWQARQPHSGAVVLTRPGSEIRIVIEAFAESADVLLNRLLALCQHAQATRVDAFGGAAKGLRVQGWAAKNILISRDACFYPMDNTSIVVIEAISEGRDAVDLETLEIINRNVARSVQPLAAAGEPVLEMREQLFEIVHPPVVRAPEPPGPKDLSKAALALTETEVEKALDLMQGSETAITEGLGAGFRMPTTLAYLAGIWTVFLVVWPRATFMVTRQVGAILSAVMLITWFAIMLDKLWSWRWRLRR